MVVIVKHKPTHDVNERRHVNHVVLLKGIVKKQPTPARPPINCAHAKKETQRRLGKLTLTEQEMCCKFLRIFTAAVGLHVEVERRSGVEGWFYPQKQFPLRKWRQRQVKPICNSHQWLNNTLSILSCLSL